VSSAERLAGVDEGIPFEPRDHAPGTSEQFSFGSFSPSAFAGFPDRSVVRGLFFFFAALLGFFFSRDANRFPGRSF
jgi:hypothetical protein